jgi:eukaryotic-like serine/threonine-protein kinase
VKHPEHADAVATRSASASAVGETRTSDPSTTATTPPGRHGAIEQLGDPERYRIIREHGRGGLGRVSRAHDRDVAVKELISRGAVSEVRFLREALITARLEHPASSRSMKPAAGQMAPRSTR